MTPRGIGRQRPGEDKPRLCYAVKSPDPEDNYYTMATEDSRGAVWFWGGMELVRFENDSFYRFRDINARYCVLDRKDRLWFLGFTPTNIPSVFAAHGARLEDISSQLPFTAINILTMTADDNGDIWIGGPRNNIFHIRETQTGRFAVADSISSPLPEGAAAVQNMQFDQYGNLWAIYGDHMLVYLRNTRGVPDGRHYIQLTPEDGMDLFMTPHVKDLRRTADGNLVLFAPPCPMLKVNEILTSFNKTGPKAYITDMLLFSKKYDWAAHNYASDDYGLPARLQLPFNKNALTFRFSSIGLHNTGYFRYQYRLKGYEGSWLDADAERKAVYTNLAPGHYTFFVRAANENGVWGKPFAYTFTILPPWYKTWWALGLWGMLLTGGVALSFYLRQRSIVKKYQVEQLITEQKLIALRAQINPHFIHNIFNFLSHKIVHETREVAVGVMAKVSVYLRNILYLSEQHVISLEDETGFIEEYLKIQQMIFNNKLTYIIDIEDDVNTFGVKVPAMLLQPIVENAVKYGVYGENDCMIHISITEDSDYITCSVSDNGITGASAGKPQEHISVGLELTKSKLAMMYARSKNKPEVTLSPNEHAGYTAVVKIPLS